MISRFNKLKVKKLVTPFTFKILYLTSISVSLAVLIFLTLISLSVFRLTDIIAIVKPVRAQEILLDDSFDRRISSSWTKFLNASDLRDEQWYWERGALYFDPTLGLDDGKRADDALIMYTGPATNPYYWQNYRFEVDAMGRRVGVWFRGRYEESDVRGQWVTGYYFMLIGGKSSVQEARLLKIQTTENCVPPCNPDNLYNFANPMLIDTYPFINDGNTIFHIRVDVIESNIKVFVDGNQIFDHNDSDFKYGTIGLRSYQRPATFDNVRVIGYPSSTLTPPPPLPTRPVGLELCDNKNGIDTAIGCIPVTSRQAFIEFILRWGGGIAGGIAFVLIIYAGLLILTSAGDPKKMEAGKELMIAAVSGLLVLLFGGFILEFVGVNILNIPGF